MSEISLVEAAVYALDCLALAILIGCGATGAWLITHSEQRAAAAPVLRRLAAIALATLIVTTTAVLLFRTAALADVTIIETAPFISRVISDSAFGTLWLGRAAVLLLLIAVWMTSRKQLWSNGYLYMATAGAAIAFCVSGVSHAGDEGTVTFDNLINTTHIVAGTLWGGAIIAAFFMLKVSRQHDITIAESVTRLSTLATIALVLVLTSGVINVWNRLETFSELLSSSYGQTLLVKLVFVAAMMAVGALNRFYIVPAVCSNQKRTPLLLRTLAVDVFLFIIVISGAAALGMQSPHL